MQEDQDLRKITRCGIEPPGNLADLGCVSIQSRKSATRQLGVDFVEISLASELIRNCVPIDYNPGTQFRILGGSQTTLNTNFQVGVLVSHGNNTASSVTWGQGATSLGVDERVSSYQCGEISRSLASATCIRCQCWIV